MIKRAILLLLLPVSSVFAETLYLRDFESNKNCRITGVTNASPAVITCAAAHNLTDGDRVFVANVAGSTGTRGLRYADAIDSTRFSIYSDSGLTIPIAASGVWRNGDGPSGWPGGPQLAGKVTGYTLSSHPRLLLDPNTGGNLILIAASVGNGLLTNIVDSGTTSEATYTQDHGLSIGDKICVFSSTDTDHNCSNTPNSGTYFTITSTPTARKIQWTTSAVTDGTYSSSDLTVSAYAQGGNPRWLDVNSGRSTLDTSSNYLYPATDFYKFRSLNQALICYINRADTTACAVAKQSVLNAEALAVNFACDTTTANCNSAYGDYASFHLAYMAQIYTLTRWQLSAGEKADFANKMLNDFTDSCVANTRTNLTGTSISGTTGSPFGSPFNITGVGTTFTSISSGSVLVPQTGSYMDENQFTFISSVTNNTTMTGSGLSVSGINYAVAGPWASNMCGAVWYLKHHPGTYGGQPYIHIPQGGNTIAGGGVSPNSNMTLNKLTGLFLIGIALADDDARARDLAAEQSIYFADYEWPWYQGHWTGFSGNGANYHYSRTSYALMNIVASIKNSVVSGPDLTSESFFALLGTQMRFLWAPGSVFTTNPYGLWGWGADGGGDFLQFGGGRDEAFAAATFFAPYSTESGKTRYWIDSVWGLTSVDPRYSGFWFLKYNPKTVAVNYTSEPTQRIFRNPNLTGCNAPGSVTCPVSGAAGYGMIISRTDWSSSTASAVGYETSSFADDHATQRAGDYIVRKGTKILVGRDHPQAAAVLGVAEPQKGNMFQFSGLTMNDGIFNTTYGNLQYRPYTPKITRWAGGSENKGRSDSVFAYWLNDLSLTWQSGVTRQYRHGLHYKRSGKTEYFIVYDDVVVASGRSLKFYHHYLENGQVGEGTTSCTGAVGCADINTNRQVNTVSATNVYSVNTKFIAPSGSNTYMVVDSTTGAYTGGNGYSYRLTSCAGTGSCSSSATTYEMMMAHKISAGTTDYIESTAINPSSLWTGAQFKDLTFLVVRGTTTPTSISSFTTTAQTDIIAAGLEPGTYEFRNGGTPISGCDAVVVSTNDTTGYCPDASAGIITVVQTGAPPDPLDITTTSLPNGTQNSAYSQTLTATGGTSPYTWDVSAGSLCTGLSMSSGGAITGTPTVAQTCSFTARVTDNAAATDTQALSITIDAAGGGGSPSVGSSSIRGTFSNRGSAVFR